MPVHPLFRRRFTPVLALLATLLAASPAAAAARKAPGRAEPRPSSARIILEGGLVLPRGDLSGDYLSTPLGAGARAGLEAGFRWRFALKPTLAAGPSYHFNNMRELVEGELEAPLYRVRATTHRYAVEALYGKRDAYRKVQPFAGVAAGLNRNRLRGDGKNDDEFIDDAVNTFSLSLRAGVRWRGLEWSLVYNRNRFASRRFFSAGDNETYNWDSVTLRMGWLIP